MQMRIRDTCKTCRLFLDSSLVLGTHNFLFKNNKKIH